MIVEMQFGCQLYRQDLKSTAAFGTSAVIGGPTGQRIAIEYVTAGRDGCCFSGQRFHGDGTDCTGGRCMLDHDGGNVGWE